MTALDDLLDTDPDLIHRHRGTCCWVRRAVNGGHSATTVRALLDDDRRGRTDLARGLSTALGEQIGTQSVDNHRAGRCYCCSDLIGPTS